MSARTRKIREEKRDERKKAEAERKQAEAALLPEHLLELGHPDSKYAESGLTKSVDLKTTLRAANWQQKNRVPVEKGVLNGKLVEPNETVKDGAEKIYVAVSEGLDSNNPSMKAAAMKAGIQLLRIVQMDDHAKLKAELRPTAITPQVVIDQSTHTDNRKVTLLIPDNGRDPQLHALE